MKNIISNKIMKSIFTICFGLITFIANAQPPSFGCDTCAYNIMRTRGMDSARSFDVPIIPVGSYYPECPPLVSKKKNVAFIHGLGGTNGSWVKQVDFTAADTGYNTASFAVDYGGYEFSFPSVSRKLQNELHSKLSSGINSSFPNRCKNEDYVIAHSQGGIAARFLDYKWDVDSSGTYGLRNFYGAVTFSTPHAGADIAFSINQHADYVQRVISAIILNDANNEIYKSSIKLSTFVGNSLVVRLGYLDTFIKKNLVPLGLASQHTGTLLEMTPNGTTMNTINNHNSQLHRVAFYATEDAPESWRVMDNFINKEAADYPLWGAQPDTDFLTTAENVRLENIAANIKLENDIKGLRKQLNVPLWGLIKALAGANKKIRVMEEVHTKRQTTVDFLNNANTQWRYLIGAYHKDSFTTKTNTTFTLTWQEKYGVLGKWYNQSRTFSTSIEAHNYYSAVQVYRKRNDTYNANLITTTTRTFFPSDGVVLEKSQKAYPGVKISDTDFMPHNNHMQVRNSSQTKRVLEFLYDGGKYDDFFKLK